MISSNVQLASIFFKLIKVKIQLQVTQRITQGEGNLLFGENIKTWSLWHNINHNKWIHQDGLTSWRLRRKDTLISSSQAWLHVGIIWARVAIKIPMPSLHPRPITSECLGVGGISTVLYSPGGCHGNKVCDPLPCSLVFSLRSLTNSDVLELVRNAESQAPRDPQSHHLNANKSQAKASKASVAN